jgi:sec-independent protein translocase protein TatA
MFDPSAPHIIILLVVVLLLFGSTRLPGAARALGSSMNIFKKSLKEGAEEEPATTIQPTHPAQATVLPPVAPVAPAQPQAAPDATQQQLLDLQRQIQDLQRQSAASGTAPSGGVAAPPPGTQQQS